MQFDYPYFKQGWGAGAAWGKNQEPEPLGKKSQEPEPLKNIRLPCPDFKNNLRRNLFFCYDGYGVEGQGFSGHVRQ